MTEEAESYDDLINHCADLLSDKKNESFVLALLSLPNGVWIDVEALSKERGIPVFDTSTFDGELYATWLDSPPSDDTYVCVVFSLPDELWSWIAKYYLGPVTDKANIPQRLQRNDLER